MVFIEQQEMARDTFKDKAAAVKTGYRKQQTTVSQSDKAMLRKKVKCESCDAQINQFALARSENFVSTNFVSSAGSLLSRSKTVRILRQQQPRKRKLSLMKHQPSSFQVSWPYLDKVLLVAM